MDELLPALLAVQGVIGGLDTLLNHEWIERLPYRSQARNEIRLHSLREATYGILFTGLAWFEWHGAAAFVIGALVLGELAITACDEFIENRIRVLPQNERVMHVFLAVNLGLIIAALAATLPDWAAQPTGWVAVDHGWVSWALTVLGVMGIAWSIRDLLAWRRLVRVAAMTDRRAAA